MRKNKTRCVASYDKGVNIGPNEVAVCVMWYEKLYQLRFTRLLYFKRDSRANSPRQLVFNPQWVRNALNEWK